MSMQLSVVDIRDAIANQKAARARLRNPPAAIADNGIINLKPWRKQPEKPVEPPRVEPETPIADYAFPLYAPLTVGPRRIPKSHPLKVQYDALIIPHLTVERIIEVVCKHYKISRMDIVSARRSSKYVFPRHVAMYLAKTWTPKSLPEIGRRFGDRDHTTVLHAVRRITRLSATVEMGDTIRRLEQQLGVGEQKIEATSE